MYFLCALFNLIAIYPVDSVIQPPNNWGLGLLVIHLIPFNEESNVSLAKNVTQRPLQPAVLSQE